MSNILIIKHGSLGDLIQANGAIKDIKESFPNSKVLLLTSEAYSYFMSSCPYIDGVLTDKRLPRWNIFYLFKLKRVLENYNFSHIFDLQNSNRTYFYRKYFLKKSIWSSTEDALEPGQKKGDFDKAGVLDRMEIQLKKTGVKTKYIHNVDLSWAIEDISRLLKKYTNSDYILIFPFCSKKHENKKWPYFKNLITKLKEHYKNKFTIITAPGPGEIEEAATLNTKIVLIDNKPVNIVTLISLIEKATFIISNDTGPAHICSHLNKKGLVLFGSHTTPEKVSIKNSNLKIIKVDNLQKLKSEDVLSETIKYLN
jgi:ADP-heptose:LPS heptosyltransferase